MKKMALVIFIFVIIFFFIYFIYNPFEIEKFNDTEVIVVLSPHYDDATLSIGGILAKSKAEKNILTFFTEDGNTEEAFLWKQGSGLNIAENSRDIRSKENLKALQILKARAFDFNFKDTESLNKDNYDDIKKEISIIITEYLSSLNSKSVSVFIPSNFGEEVNHPDHLLLHEASLYVINNFSDNSNYIFYFYEDYPYIEKYLQKYTNFEKSNFKKNLKKKTNLEMDKVYFFMDNQTTNLKKTSNEFYVSQILAFKNIAGEDLLMKLDSFNKKRCGIFLRSCEVIYKINTN